MKRHTEYERISLPKAIDGTEVRLTTLFIIRDDYSECKLNDYNLIKRCKLEAVESGVITMRCNRLMCVPDKAKAYVERYAFVSPDYVKEFETELSLFSGDFVFTGSGWRDDDSRIEIV